MGGEYYRATRPAALAAWKFGWTTAACTKMATFEDNDGGPLSFVTTTGGVITPEIIVLRPVREWRQHWTDQAHANGQLVIADLDDDLWMHEKYEELSVTQPDFYNEWFWNADGVIVSTRHLAARLRDMGHRSPIVVAPNCYDPFGLNSSPRPGNVIGTRLWLGGRMEADLELYDRLMLPLLEDLDLQFMHVGADVDQGRFVDRGWPEDRLIERRSVLIPQLGDALAGLNIGAICMADHPYNDAKTETHAVELASIGVPLVAASTHRLYRNVPGRVDPAVDDVRERVRQLLEPYTWLKESDRSRRWARSLSLKSESRHLESLLRIVNVLTSRRARYEVGP